MARASIGRVSRRAERSLGFVGVGVLLLVLSLSCARWDKLLPFRENELDPELLGFWLRIETSEKNRRRRDSIGVEELVQIKREGEYYKVLTLSCSFESFGRVVRKRDKLVFTKGEYLYHVRVIDGISHLLEAVPYEVRRDTLFVGDGWFFMLRCGNYERVADTSGVDWAVRRIINAKKKP